MSTSIDCYTQLRLHQSTRGMSDAEVREIAGYAQVVRFQAGDVVLESGEPVDALYLMSAGRVRLSIIVAGSEEKVIAYAGRGDQVGLLSMLQNEPSFLSVVAVQPCIAIRVDADQAVRLLEESSLWGRNLIGRIGPQLRETLLGSHRKERKRFVVLINATRKCHWVTQELIKRLAALGESIAVASDRADDLPPSVVHKLSLIDSKGRFQTPHELRQWATKWDDAERIVLDCELSNVQSYLDEYVIASGATYVVCDTETTDLVVDHIRPVLEAAPRLQEKINLIRVLSKDEQVAPVFPQLFSVCNRDFKLHSDQRAIETKVCNRQAGIDRLMHHLRGVSIGLALGGGAARGMAHLGVLQVFEEAGITIDRMSGTSAGSLVGIPYAAGYSADFLINAFKKDLQPGWIYRMMPYGDLIYVVLKYRFNGWDPMLRVYLNDWKLEQLAIPFSSVAVDLVLAEPVIRQSGDATVSVLESINLPGVARPICDSGMALVDGGVLDVVPADVVVSQGANVVVSSDVSAKIKFEFSGIQPDTPTAKMKRPGGTASLIRMRTVQDRNIRLVGGGAADLVIEPDISEVELTDFKHADQTAKLGRAAALEMLPKIKQALHEMDPQLFPF